MNERNRTLCSIKINKLIRDKIKAKMVVTKINEEDILHVHITGYKQVTFVHDINMTAFGLVFGYEDVINEIFNEYSKFILERFFEHPENLSVDIHLANMFRELMFGKKESDLNEDI